MSVNEAEEALSGRFNFFLLGFRVVQRPVSVGGEVRPRDWPPFLLVRGAFEPPLTLLGSQQD